MAEEKIKILNWGVSTFATCITEAPLVTIKPSLDFQQTCREKEYSVMVRISGTDSGYEGVFEGRVVQGCDVKSKRCLSDYCDSDKETEIVLILSTQWLGFPTNNGMISLEDYDVSTPYCERDEIEINKSVKGFHQNPVNNKKSEKSHEECVSNHPERVRPKCDVPIRDPFYLPCKPCEEVL